MINANFDASIVAVDRAEMLEVAVSEELTFDNEPRGDDKRLFPRRPLDEEFYCYLPSGERFDASSLDISSGGIFLTTNDDIEVQTPVTLVFKARPGVSQPVYLLGVVVRLKARAPNVGVGVQWERAVSSSPPEELGIFLDEVLLVPKAAVVVEPGARTGMKQSVYHFPRFVASSGQDLDDYEEIEEEDTEELVPAAAKRKRDRARRAKRTERTTAPVPMLPREASHSYSRTKEDGALTRQIRTGAMLAPCDIQATVKARLRKMDAKIAAIGLKSMLIHLASPPKSTLTNVTVSFELRVKGGMAPVSCKCKVTAVGAGTSTLSTAMDLEINSVNEGTEIGLLRDYVRWLSLRKMAGR